MRSIPYTIYDAKTKLVQPEASRGQKRRPLMFLKGRWATERFLQVHMAGVRLPFTEHSSIQSAAPGLAQRCCGLPGKLGFILCFLLAQAQKNTRGK